MIENDVPVAPHYRADEPPAVLPGSGGLLVGASVLPAGSAAGAVSVAFAGEVPVTVHAARVSGAGVSASPGLSGRGGLLPAPATGLEKATVEDACVTSTVNLPVGGAVTAVVRVKRASATDLTAEAGMATARSVTLSGAKLSTPQVSLDRPTGLFTVGADQVSAGGVSVQPHAFTAGTITSQGVSVELRRGEGGCEPGTARWRRRCGPVGGPGGLWRRSRPFAAGLLLGLGGLLLGFLLTAVGSALALAWIPQQAPSNPQES